MNGYICESGRHIVHKESKTVLGKKFDKEKRYEMFEYFFKKAVEFEQNLSWSERIVMPVPFFGKYSKSKENGIEVETENIFNYFKIKNNFLKIEKENLRDFYKNIIKNYNFLGLSVREEKNFYKIFFEDNGNKELSEEKIFSLANNFTEKVNSEFEVIAVHKDTAIDFKTKLSNKNKGDGLIYLLEKDLKLPSEKTIIIGVGDTISDLSMMKPKFKGFETYFFMVGNNILREGVKNVENFSEFIEQVKKIFFKKEKFLI